MNTQHIGSNFDDFLAEQGILDECSAAAAKRVLAWQLQQAMQEQNMTKTQLAALMKTSRASINRLLDPENAAVNLQTMEKAARAVGKRLEIQLA
jgi:hypothetical protein